MAAVPRELVIERERRAWELRCQGWTHARIAATLDVDPSTITKLLGRLSARYAQRHADQIAAVKGEQIAQLEQIADEALQAWRRSIGEIDTVTRKTTTVMAIGSEGSAQELPGEEVTTRTETKAGEVAYLSEARGALADIRKVLGMDALLKAGTPDDQQDAIKVYIGIELDRV